MGERSINIRLNRALGQNFLKSAKISRRIVESASLDPSLTIARLVLIRLAHFNLTGIGVYCDRF